MTDLQAIILIWLTLFNQGQRAEKTLKDVIEFSKQFGNDYQRFIKMDYYQIEKAIYFPRKLHRFPKKMAMYIFDSLSTINERFDGKASKVFWNVGKVQENLLLFKGIGEHKARVGTYFSECFFDMDNVVSQIVTIPCNLDIEIVYDELLYLKSLGK